MDISVKKIFLSVRDWGGSNDQTSECDFGWQVKKGWKTLV